MSDEKILPMTAPTDRNADFFITELAHMSESYDRQYTSMARRVTLLEQRLKSTDEDDPSKMMASVIGIIIAMQLLPVIVEMIQGWRGKSKV